MKITDSIQKQLPTRVSLIIGLSALLINQSYWLKMARRLRILPLLTGLCLSLLPMQTLSQQASQDILPGQIRESVSRIQRLYFGTQMDSLKVHLKVLAGLIKKQENILNTIELGEAKSLYHLYKGYYYRDILKLDSATYHFQTAMEIRSKSNNYKGWYEPMSLSVDYLAIQNDRQEYLYKLETGYKKLRSNNPEEAKRQYGNYLADQFWAVTKEEEKLKILKATDSLVSTGLGQLDGYTAVKFYIEVLKWCYKKNNQELIAKYEAKFEKVIKENGVSEVIQNFSRGEFMRIAKNTSEAIHYYTLVANDPISSPFYLKPSYKGLTNLYLIRDDTIQTFRNYKNLIKIREDVDFSAGKTKAEELQTALEKQILRNKILEEELIGKQARLINVSLVLSIAMLGLVIVAILERSQKKKNLIKSKHAELNLLKAEIKNKDMMFASKMALLEQLKNRMQNENVMINQSEVPNKKTQPVNSKNASINQEIDTDVEIKLIPLQSSERQVEEIPAFILEYLRKFPLEFTGRELKLITFMNSGFDNQDLEKIFGVSGEAIRRAKWRLKKKLNLNQETNFDEWARKIGR